jgi:tetratricopeptide (TPR) repeat protein
LSVVAAPARAQDDPHAACAAPPSYVPPDLLERPVVLRAGVGNSHEPVTTTSKEAQAYYDQGLNYLESYVWIEAARSFHQALRFDPRLAMAYVGLSRVHSGLDDAEGARRYFEKAKGLAANAGDRERRRIEIREAQLAAMEDLQDVVGQQAYKKTIENALASDLDDSQLWLLGGNAEEPTAAGRGQRGTAASVAFYEQVLLLQPNHASAHHYLVHSFENLGRIDKALEHGEIFARMAPSIPHAAHMYGHDLRRVGRIDDAIAQFLKADRLEREYYQADNIDPALDWHHSHNLDLLATCYEYKGQMKLAEKIMREVAALGTPDAYRAFNARILPSFLIHRTRYQEALDAARAMTRSDFPQARAVGRALATQALVASGRLAEAGEELALAEVELERVPAVTAGVTPRRSQIESWITLARGQLLLKTDAKVEGRAVLENAQRELRAIPGPDAWTQALFHLEVIARSAREVGDWDLAEYTARQMLDHDSAYGGSHLAMGLVLRERGDVSSAERELKDARKAWHQADPGLPELKQIASLLASLQ